jgi:ABC-2 type transport system ATP-binding protein
MSPAPDARAPAHDGIILENVEKTFGPVRALDGMSLEIKPGEVVGVLGPNGAGKSTLIRVLATSVIPDAGRAWVGGHDAIAHPDRSRRCVGLVLGEDRSFFWRLNGRQNLEFFAAMYGLSRKAARPAVNDALDAVGLLEVGDRRVDRYSTGMRSRLGIARALLGSPAALLLDEPTRSLDPGSSLNVRSLVRRLASERQVAVLLATHDLHEAADLAVRVAIVSKGKVVQMRTDDDAASLEAAVIAAGAGAPT